jgi:hypothetical protein
MPDLSATWGAPAGSLPTHSRTEQLKRARQRVKGAEKYRRDEGFDKTWERLRDIYRLKMFSGASGEDRILVAVAFATINVIEPSVAINHPKIVVTATAEQFRDQATIAEAVVNYWWRHYDLQPEFRRAVKDFLVYGHGWIKVGYRYEEGEVERDPEDMAMEADELAVQADEYAQANPELAASLPTNDEIAEQIEPTESEIIEDRPFVERVSVFDILVDPDATDLSDAGWIAQRVVRPLEEVKADERYKSGARRRLESDGASVWHIENSKNKVTADAERVTLWEYYDLRRKTVGVFAESFDGWLLDPVELPYVYGHPFVMIRDYNVPDQFYPIGELEAIEPLQNELNETRSSMVRARKTDIRKWIAKKDALTPNAIDSLKSDRDNTVVVIEDPNIPLAEVIAPLPSNTPQAALYQHSEVVLADIDRVSGVSEYARGELPEIRRTATEASIIQDAANARAADKLDTVQLAIAEIGQRLVQLGQQYMTQPQTARITGMNGGEAWFEFEREDIDGEFDFNVEAGSTQPKNETFRRQSALQLLQTVGPLMEAGIVNPVAIAEHVLRDGFDISNPEKFIIQPDPEAQDQPDEKLITTMNYADAPPDIQRQIEAMAGFEPSQYGMLTPDMVESEKDREMSAEQSKDQRNAEAVESALQRNSQFREGESKREIEREKIGNGPEGRRKQLQGQVGLDKPGE